MKASFKGHRVTEVLRKIKLRQIVSKTQVRLR